MKSWKILICMIVAVSLVAAPSFAGKKKEQMKQLEEQLKAKEAALSELEATTKQLERDLKQQMRELESKSSKLEQAQSAVQRAEERAREAEIAARQTTAPAESRSALTSGSELLPPNAKPGECYARVFVPPTYGTESIRTLKHEASERIEIVPAKFEWVEETVLVKEGSERLQVIPAKYEWVEERVLVKPASVRKEQVPAQYEWVEEKILVEPAHTTWKKGRGPIEKIDDSTGEIMCLVDVPAKYKTVKKKTLKSGPTTREVKIPAEYKNVKKQVMVQAAKTVKTEIPAEYKTVRVQKMVSPAKEKRISIPEEWGTVTKKVQLTSGKMDWRPVLCETNMTHSTVKDIQRALQRAGHNPGPIDGVYGSQTASAVRSYQQAKGLSTGGLTVETIQKLGLSI